MTILETIIIYMLKFALITSFVGIVIIVDIIGLVIILGLIVELLSFIGYIIMKLIVLGTFLGHLIYDGIKGLIKGMKNGIRF